MAKPSEPVRVGIAAAAAGVLVAVAIGLISPKPDHDRRHVRFEFGDAGQPASCRCIKTNARGPATSWAAVGIERADGGTGWVLVLACGEPREDGMVALPGGVEVNENTHEELPCAPDSPKLEVWESTDNSAPWSCACRSPSYEAANRDAGVCEALLYVPVDGGVAEKWVVAPPVARTFPAGKWRGACVGLPCDELAGHHVVPAACCEGACAGRACGEGLCGESCGTCADGLVCRGYSCIAAPSVDGGTL